MNLTRIKNKMLNIKFFKRMVYKKCKDCKYLYKGNGLIFCCSNVWIGPLKFICFDKKKGESKWNFKK